MTDMLSNKDDGKAPESVPIESLPDEVKALIDALNQENLQISQSRDRLLNEVEDIKIRVAQELSLYKGLDKQYSEVLHILGNMRQVLLGGRVSGDEIFDRWSEKCLETPGHIVGLAKDVSRELLAMRDNSDFKLSDASSTEKKDDKTHGAEMFSSLSTEVEEPKVKKGDPERALVAFSVDTDDALVICSSGYIVEDHIERIGKSDAKVLDLIGHGNDPFSNDLWGLFVWEGVPNKNEDGSVDYQKGVWRDPHKEEWINILDGDEPWASALESSDEETD